MEYEVVNNRLKELLEKHGLGCGENEHWVIPNGCFPLIRMTWYPKPEQKSGVLQIDIQISQEICMQECFAGIGDSEVGLNDAFHNFCVNSLHVMLAAFWGIIDSQQVEIEEWIIGGDEYTAYIGPFGTRGQQGVHPGIPDGAFEIIESAIKGTKLAGSVSWFRNYFCNIKQESKFHESLFNNEEWPKGVDALKKIDWLKSDTFYSVRNFIVVVKHT